jgi:hypothetical protein
VRSKQPAGLRIGEAIIAKNQGKLVIPVQYHPDRKRYQRRGLPVQSIPNLRFELLTALAGVNSVTVYYRGHRGLSAEVLHFGPSGKVREAFAHYAE